MRLLRPLSALAVLLVAAVAAVGCGETVIDDVKTEGALEQNLESSLGRQVKEVDCPSGVEVEAKATFECSVVLADGKTETATLQIINDDADVEVTNIGPAGGSDK
jgi:Domain of unknown function (DUF4333)